MGLWSALALPSVDKSSIEHALASKSITPESVAHVSATSSHAGAVRKTGQISVAIANLIDLIVMTGLDEDSGLTLSDFPSGEVFRQGEDPLVVEQRYRISIKSWQNKLKAKRTSLSVSSGTELRKFLRQPNVDTLSARVLLDSKRDFLKTMQTLVASGIFPNDLKPADKVGQVAKLAWAKLEATLPALTATRDDIWMDPEEFANLVTPKAKNLSKRITSALDQIFAIESEKLTIVYHGFYFFTPQQWALFQLLRKMPKVDQIFIVHDDGQNPVFETWRRFFCEGWYMPKVELIAAKDDTTTQAKLFRHALGGNAVDPQKLQGFIDIKECKNPAEFVRQLNFDRAIRPKEFEREPLAYASGSADLKRITRRISRTAADGVAELAQLPLGAFLLSTHECIKRSNNQRLSIELSAKPLLDMITSGFLDDVTDSCSNFLDVFERVLPFFSDCVDKTAWLLRADSFHRLVADEVVTRGQRLDDQSDLEYMRNAAHNPLRRVPWLDVTLTEAALVKNTITKVCSLITGIASGEEVKLADYMEFLDKYLAKALREVPQAERQEVVDKFQSFRFKDDETVFVDDLVDIVHLLISRENDFDLKDDGDFELDDVVTELRALDALGFKRLDRGLHLANLADGIFPSRIKSIGWPFRIENIEINDEGVSPVSLEILQARSQNSALSELYLFWLALDGVTDGKLVTLSWISDTGREEQNLSPVVSILAVPDHFSAAVLKMVGGVRISAVASAAGLPPTRSCPQPPMPTISVEVLDNAIAHIDKRAIASSLICARRFAVQWAMGDSSAFLASHHQAQLYGNAIGALSRRERITEDAAKGVCNDLWRFMTNGERESSLSSARVMSHERCNAKKVGSADEWTFSLTIQGKKKDATDPFSNAYRFASDWRNPDLQVLNSNEVAPKEMRFLPMRNVNVGNADICKDCPVKSRCLAADESEV